VNLASGKVSFLTPVQYANSIFRKSIFSDRHVDCQYKRFVPKKSLQQFRTRKLCSRNQPCHKRDHSSKRDRSLRLGFSLVCCGVCCSALQCLATLSLQSVLCCIVLQCVLRRVAVSCRSGRVMCVIVCCSVLQLVLQYTAESRRHCLAVFVNQVFYNCVV